MSKNLITPKQIQSVPSGKIVDESIFNQENLTATLNFIKTKLESNKPTLIKPDGSTQEFDSLQDMFNAIPEATNSQTIRTVWVAYIPSGTYDMDLTIQLYRRKIVVVTEGAVNIGAFTGSSWGAGATPARNVTIVVNNQSGIDSIRHGIVFTSVNSYGEGKSSHQSYLSKFRINGNLIWNYTGVGATTSEFHFEGEVFGDMDFTGYAGGINAYLYSGRVRGLVKGDYVDASGPILNLQVASNMRFDSKVSCRGYSQIKYSDIKAGMVVSATISDIQPVGFFNTNFAGNFEGPGQFRVDPYTEKSFMDNGGSLLSGATLVHMFDKTSGGGGNVDGGTAGTAGDIIQHRRDTTTAWSAANPVLEAGVIALESDTNKFKIGDGTTAWNSLAYASAEGLDGADGKSAYEVWLDLGNSGSEADFLNSLKGANGADGQSSYQSWLNIGNSGTEADFINYLKGQDGTNGIDGVDGKSAYQTWLEAGNSGSEIDFLNAITGADGEDGEHGKSAYEIWLELGNSGTEADFINAMKGKSAYQIWQDLGNSGTEADFINSLKGTDGSDGKSAYQTWVDAGNSGTEVDFLNSLKGADGIDGNDGTDGKSAYQIWLDAGNPGSEVDFLNSLKGADGQDGLNGTDGIDGKSAYEIWVDAGNSGSEADFLNSLKGADGQDGLNGTDGIDGTDGKSAYEIWVDAGNSGSEADFLNSLKGADGVGVPTGGTTGQVLAKASDNDNDTTWVNPPTGGGGSAEQYYIELPVADTLADRIVHPNVVLPSGWTLSRGDQTPFAQQCTTDEDLIVTHNLGKFVEVTFIVDMAGIPPTFNYSHSLTRIAAGTVPGGEQMPIEQLTDKFGLVRCQTIASSERGIWRIYVRPLNSSN